MLLFFFFKANYGSVYHASHLPNMTAGCYQNCYKINLHLTMDMPEYYETMTLDMMHQFIQHTLQDYFDRDHSIPVIYAKERHTACLSLPGCCTIG